MDQPTKESVKQLTVLTNRSSNSGRAEVKGYKVSQLLTSLGHHVEHHLPDDIQQTYEMVQTAVAADQHIIAVGGDGFIHQIIQECAETPATLGIVAAGTGNDFAFALGLPSPLEAAALAAISPARDVDLLRCDGLDGHKRYGATIATAGFSAAVNIRADGMAWPRGSTRYTLATLLELARLPRYELDLVIDGIGVDGSCLMVAIANTKAFGGGMQIAPNADPTAGILDVVVVRDTSALSLLRMLPKTFKGRHLDHPAVEVRTGRCIQLGLRRPNHSAQLNLRSDGEDVGSLPQTVTVVPGGLRVAGASPLVPIAGEVKENTE